MRSLKLILTASGFVTFFVGVVVVSALTTSVVFGPVATAAPLTVVIQ